MSEFKHKIKEWEINNKKFKSPTIFPRIRTIEEYSIFNDLNKKFGLKHMGGYVVNSYRLPSVFPGIPPNKKQKLLIKQRTDKKVLIIDPCIDKLFSSSNKELKDFYKLKELFPKSKHIFTKIKIILDYYKQTENLEKLKKNKSKREQQAIDRNIHGIKSDINANKVNENDINMAFYEEVFRLQDHFLSDNITIPSLPISYQMNKNDMDNCFRVTSNAVNLANTLYPDTKKMLILNLRKNALLRGANIPTEKEKKFDISDKYDLFPKDFLSMVEDALPEREKIWGSVLRMNEFTKLNVDSIGIKIFDYHFDPISEIVLVYFTSYLRELIDEKYLHFFDMDETFYALFSRGADSYSGPVSTIPFMMRSISGVPKEGNWYHPVDKLFYPRNRDAINLYDMQKEEKYKIPCPCKICEAYVTFKKIEEDAEEKTKISGKELKTEFNKLWNEYRRRHWFCYKDLEMEELQRDDTRLIKEEIARSKRQDLHSFFQ